MRARNVRCMLTHFKKMRVPVHLVALLLLAGIARAFESFQRLVPNGDRVRTKDGKLWEGMGQYAA